MVTVAAVLCLIVLVYHIYINPLIAGNMPNTKTTSRGATVRKCPICPFQSSNHTVWRDHMAECYETRFFCKQCDYSTEKKANYLRHIKRKHSTSHSEESTPSCSRSIGATCDDTENNQRSEPSKETEEQETSASEDEEWLAEDPDISIGEGVETVQTRDTEAQLTCDPTVRKRTCPQPVYNPVPSKVSRPVVPESEQRDIPTQPNTCAYILSEKKLVDTGMQTEPVRYTKSIITTTIVKENGRKVITVKKEKML